MSIFGLVQRHQEILQTDSNHTYDALQTAYINKSVIYAVQQFTYDAIYRLIQASGREHLSIAPQWDEFINVQQAHKGDATAISNYTESYIYDEVGNITFQHHERTPNNSIRFRSITG